MSFQEFEDEPKSSVLLASDINDVLMATPTRLDKAALAPPAPVTRQVPLIEKHPFDKSMPLANVEVTELEVMLKAVVESPAPKVEVVVP